MKKVSFAHRHSFSSQIDPLYSATTLLPEPDTDPHAAPWLYGECEWECYRLEQLRAQVEKSKLKVGYPGEFHRHAEKICFYHPLARNRELLFRACGNVAVDIDGAEIYHAEQRSDLHRVIIPEGFLPDSCLRITLSSRNGLPGLQVVSASCRTDDGLWECSTGTRRHPPAAFRPSCNGTAPHERKCAGTREITPRRREGRLFDFGVELYGKVLLQGRETPSLSVGESEAEALNEKREDQEQSVEIVRVSNDLWMSRDPLAFRYVRAEKAEKVTCLAEFRPECYRGAFACSDPLLNDIWCRSAYTLRLCMRDFLLDGLKRDRLPWVGDLMVSLMGNAYVFADAEIVRQTLSVLGRGGISSCHLNGIVDYSLWWVICHHCFQLYFADTAYLRKEWRRIRNLMGCLESQCTGEGILVPDAGDWIFIDWVKCEKYTALQMLWHWALISASGLAERLGEESSAARWRKTAHALKRTLRRRAWNLAAGHWLLPSDDPVPSASRHAQFFSILSGIAERTQLPSVRSALLGDALSPVGTPYMATFENLALAQLKAVPEILRRVKRYWGAMIAAGATTFWEACDPEEKDASVYAFYNRPFGKSLCHAWSAGPAAFLPRALFGLEILSDGWKHFRIAPVAGSLEWAALTIPSPQGDLEIVRKGKQLLFDLPPGCTAECNGRILRGEGSIPA